MSCGRTHARARTRAIPSHTTRQPRFRFTRARGSGFTAFTAHARVAKSSSLLISHQASSRRQWQNSQEQIKIIKAKEVKPQPAARDPWEHARKHCCRAACKTHRAAAAGAINKFPSSLFTVCSRYQTEPETLII